MSNSAKQNSSNDFIDRRSVGEWLSSPFTWRIPVYQRHYAWYAKNESGPVHRFWETVKEQTVERLQGKAPSPHYLGAVLVDNKTRPESPIYEVVDGQQRLTTIQLALLALVDVAKKDHADAKEELEKYIFSDKSRTVPKLQPTNFDSEQFDSVVKLVSGARPMRADNTVTPDENAMKSKGKESKVMSTFRFFCEEVQKLIFDHKDEFGPSKTLTSLRETILDGFDLVLIALRETDEAQSVFESLNNYSEPLTTFDLIRNHVFRRAAKDDGPEKDKELFRMSIWQDLEDPYWSDAAGQRSDKNPHIEAYIARMLVAKMPNENIKFNRNDIFKAYKKFSDIYPNVVDEVKSVGEYADIYKHLATSTEKNPVPGFRFGVFRWDAWKNKDFYPLIFIIMKSGIDIVEQQKMINLLEIYVVRRGVCGLTSGHYNEDVASMCKNIVECPNYSELHKILKTPVGDTSRFPNDDEVRFGCLATSFYKSLFSAYIFEEIVKCKDKSIGDEIDISREKKLTVDHILPQGWLQNPEWKNALLGQDKNLEDWTKFKVRQNIDTIGNLTLMSQGQNSKKSNKSWKSAQVLLRESGFRMNRELAEKSEWGLSEIEARGRDLAEVICQRWPLDI